MIKKLEKIFESMIRAFEENGHRRAEQYLKLYGSKMGGFK